jgi:hypothetical protein
VPSVPAARSQVSFSVDSPLHVVSFTGKMLLHPAGQSAVPSVAGSRSHVCSVVLPTWHPAGHRAEPSVESSRSHVSRSRPFTVVPEQIAISSLSQQPAGHRAVPSVAGSKSHVDPASRWPTLR